jgi:hypothetical protein
MLRGLMVRAVLGLALTTGCMCGRSSGDGDVRVTRSFPAFDPATVDFGSLRIGDAPVTKTAVLWNNGGAGGLIVTSARIENDTRSAYRLVSSAPTGDADSVAYVLEHRASPSAGTDTATLVVELQDADPARIDVPLTGRTLDACPANTVGCGEACLNVGTDVANCGACGQACPAPTHAAATCVAGKCRRTHCEKGYYDVDGDTTLGCESTCAGKTCTAASGSVVTLDAAPLPEWSLHVAGAVSAGSAGSETQTNSRYTNVATLGEATPPPPDGVRETQNAHFKNIGGLNAAHTAP